MREFAQTRTPGRRLNSSSADCSAWTATTSLVDVTSSLSSGVEKALSASSRDRVAAPDGEANIGIGFAVGRCVMAPWMPAGSMAATAR